MNTKECPYCHEEISEDAILCKYCHNLLTDDDDEPTMVFKPDPEDDERTRVFSASEAVKNTREPSRGYSDDEYDDEEYDDDDDRYDDDDEYDDDEYDDDDEYEDDDDYDDDSAKRTFITAAVITLGILLIVIVAIVAGYKIFGNKDDDQAPSLSTSMIQNDTSKGNTSAKPADASMNEDSKGEESKDASSDEASSQDDTSSKDDTSSEDDTSSKEESSSVPDSSSAPDSSSKEESSSNNEESSSNSDSSSTADGPDREKIIAKATEIIGQHNTSGMKSYTYREEDSKNTAMEYYYILMNDNKNYSVAYNTNTGKCIVAGGGERYEG